MITRVKCRECGAMMKQTTDDPEERWQRLRRHYMNRHAGLNGKIQNWIRNSEQTTTVLDMQ